jgi:uncharacterized membrane protein YphA (DoxX/SURF4 family)
MKLSNLTLGRANDRINGWIIGAMRIVLGVLWLANLEWKRPGDFGQNNKNGLYKYVASAIDHPVFGPYSWFVKNVVLKQYVAFGWMTLLLETTLAVLLILGLWVRPAALLGVGLSVSILLSVLYFENSAGQRIEWPWSYFLMVAAHLLVFACDAGKHLGLDGAIRNNNFTSVRRTISVSAIVLGIAGFVVARNISFTADRGAMFGWANWELKLIWFNRLSALLTIGLGILALVGTLKKLKIATLIASAGFAIMALQVIVQWRYNDGSNQTGGILGGTGGSMAIWALLAVGLFTGSRTAPSERSLPDAAR